MTVASPAMRELDLEAEGLRWVAPDAIMAHPFEDGTAIALHHDLDATVASLDRAHPGAGRRWRELIEQCRPLAQNLVETILGPLPPVRGADRPGRGPAPGCAAARPAHDRLGGGFRPRRIRRVRCARPPGWPARRSIPGCRRRRPAAARSASCCSWSPTRTAGRSRPVARGGWPTRCCRSPPARASSVRCDAHVRARAGHGRSRRRRRAGERRGDPARDVLTTISARPLAALLPEDALPHRLLRRLRIWRYGTAAFKLDYALRAPVPWTAPSARGGGRARRRRAARARGGGAGRGPRRGARASRAGRRSAHPVRPLPRARRQPHPVLLRPRPRPLRLLGR
jgi:hypothetical protein